MEELKEILVRPADVSILVDYGTGIGKDTYKKINAGFNTALYVIRKGSMTEYRSNKEENNVKKAFFNLFFKNPKKIKKIIEKFKKDYAKLENLVEKSKNIKDLTKEEIIELIKEFSLVYRVIWYPVLIVYWIPLWIDRNKLSDKEKKRFDYLVKVRARRDKEYVSAMFFFDNIYNYIKNNFPDLDYVLEILTPLEIISILENGKLSKNIVKEIELRSKGCFVFQRKVISFKKWKDINDFLKKYRLKIPEEKKIGKTNLVKGNVACSGRKIEGKVKLLFSKKDMSKIYKGDIIVTPMTTPYFNPVLRKARAIITDEGGVTCHASILAREFKIPCIIGTKIATKVFKDGDIIEVDANKGVVRKVK